MPTKLTNDVLISTELEDIATETTSEFHSVSIHINTQDLSDGVILHLEKVLRDSVSGM